MVEARQPNRLLGTIIPFASVGLVAANSLIGYNGESFHVNNEGWFQSNTRDGGADKASHFADYYIVAKDLKPDVEDRVSKLQIPGIVTEGTSKRVYPNGSVAGG